jgi:hypothetical protein
MALGHVGGVRRDFVMPSVMLSRLGRLRCSFSVASKLGETNKSIMAAPMPDSMSSWPVSVLLWSQFGAGVYRQFKSATIHQCRLVGHFGDEPDETCGGFFYGAFFSKPLTRRNIRSLIDQVRRAHEVEF